ncbi:hypothetical protein KKH39_00650 [Patescibacteria group bacterium]|nr:hypothetical protein [Patescibacteria group bacterium]
MDNITIKNTYSKNGKWKFDVEIGDDSNRQMYSVVLDRDYYIYLTNEKIPAGQLIQDVFMFLLSHESKEKIISDFDVRQVKDYFPDFEKDIKVY